MTDSEKGENRSLLYELGDACSAIARLQVHLTYPGNWRRAAAVARAVEASASAGLDGQGVSADVILHVHAGAHHPAAGGAAWLGRDVLRALESLDRLEFDGDRLPTETALARLRLTTTASGQAYLAQGPSGATPEALKRYLASGDPKDWPTGSTVGTSVKDADKVMTWLERSRRTIEEDEVGHSLLSLASIYRDFLAIGPFGEACGRVARLLVPALLRSWGWTPAAPALFVSQALASMPAERLNAAFGNPQAWTRLFLRILKVSARTQEDRIVAFSKLEKTLALKAKDEWRRSTSTLPAAVGWLFEHPVFTPEMLARALGLGSAGGRLVAGKLGAAGIVQPSRRGPYKAYTAWVLLEAVKPNRDP